MEKELNLGPNEYQLAVSILFVTYCVSRDDACIALSVRVTDRHF